jgi:subtilisin family serine protease
LGKKLKSEILLLILFVSIFSLIFIRHSEAIFGANLQIQEESLKRIVIQKHGATLPQSPNIWSEQSEIIEPVISLYNATILDSNPDYAFSVATVNKENYEDLVNSLREMGYKVDDDIPATLYLNDSVSSIGLPYTYGSPIHSLTGRGRQIAIVDTGIDLNHEDFQNKTIFQDDETGEGISDRMGHGTHVASIAAGTGAGSGGKYKGVAPDADLIIVKANYPNEIASGINWIVNNHPNVDVISMSMGWDGTPDRCDGSTGDSQYAAVFNEINNAIASGISFVAAAGNSGPAFNTIAFPACMENVIAVGATLKKNYNCNEDGCYFDTDLTRIRYVSNYTQIHYIINLTSENRIIDEGNFTGKGEQKDPLNVLSYTTGFERTFKPNNWSATVEVKIEGKNRFRACTQSAYEWWDPGNENQGDEYWTWTETFSNPDNQYIAVEIYNRPILTQGTCYNPFEPGWWSHYYSRDSLSVTMYQTNSKYNEKHVIGLSSRGPSPNGLMKPDISAPGVNICAARSDWEIFTGEKKCTLTCDNDRYMECGGTSMAAPHVAGLIALLREANPDADINSIRHALQLADQRIFEDMGHPDVIEGFGSINQKAINYLTNCSLKFKDGWYCSGTDRCGSGEGDTCEYRDYYFNELNEACTYSVESFHNSRCDAYDSDGLEFTTKGTCIDYQGCSSNIDKNISFTDYCTGGSTYLREYYISGTGDSATCISKSKNCKDYGSNYVCNSGRCVLCSCTPWEMIECDDYGYYGSICSICYLKRTCTPSKCAMETKRVKACQ